MWVSLWVSLVKSSWIVVKWVSWGWCQTTFGIGGSVEWVISGLSVAAPESRNGIFSLNSGLQPGGFPLSHFEWLFLGPDFVFPVSSAGEAVYWLHWLHDSISLWNGFSCHMSHTVGKQFLAFFRLCGSFCCCCCKDCWRCRVRGIDITDIVSRKILIFFQFVLAVFSTIGTDFHIVLVFYSSGTLVWFCQHLHLQYCGSQYLFEAHQGLPNHLALILFLGVSQSVHMCHFPSGPDLPIFSGAVASWHIWIVQWWHGQQFRMRF